MNRGWRVGKVFFFLRGGVRVEEASAFIKHGFSQVRGPRGMPLVTGGSLIKS